MGHCSTLRTTPTLSQQLLCIPQPGPRMCSIYAIHRSCGTKCWPTHANSSNGGLVGLVVRANGPRPAMIFPLDTEFDPVQLTIRSHAKWTKTGQHQKQPVDSHWASFGPFEPLGLKPQPWPWVLKPRPWLTPSLPRKPKNRPEMSTGSSVSPGKRADTPRAKAQSLPKAKISAWLASRVDGSDGRVPP